jgi:hypothetical protein
MEVLRDVWFCIFSDMDVLEWVCLNSVSKKFASIIRELTKQRKYPIQHDTFTSAAIYAGYLDVLKWLHHTQHEIAKLAANAAGQAGHLPILQYLDDVGIPITDEVSMFASENNHFHIVDWLMNNDKPHDVDLIGCAAAYRGNMTMFLRVVALGFLTNTDSDTHSLVSGMVASSGNFEMLKWLHEHKYLSGDTYQHALALYDHLNALIWCKEQGLKHQENTFHAAASAGHIHVLTWLCANYRTVNACIIMTGVAAAYGQLTVLQWLATNGDLRLTAEAMLRAIQHGQLTVVQWCHRPDFATNKEMCLEAAKYDHPDILDWLIEQGYVCNLQECKNQRNDRMIAFRAAMKKYSL